jgi:hypothetical protein
LTAIDASDRGGDPKLNKPYVWPNDAKQAHNFDTHLPAAMAEYERHKWDNGWAWRRPPLLYIAAAMFGQGICGKRWGRPGASQQARRGM